MIKGFDILVLLDHIILTLSLTWFYFQDSHLGTYKNLWSKMQSFINEGHDVLSANHSKHMEMLVNEKYAYMVDLTTAQYFVSQHCDYAIGPEQFFPMPYTIALQFNSAYIDEITQL